MVDVPADAVCIAEKAKSASIYMTFLQRCYAVTGLQTEIWSEFVAIGYRNVNFFEHIHAPQTRSNDSFFDYSAICDSLDYLH